MAIKDKIIRRLMVLHLCLIVTQEDCTWEDGYRKAWNYDKIVCSTHGVNCTGSCSLPGEIWHLLPTGVVCLVKWLAPINFSSY
jgi:hypothetical protein